MSKSGDINDYELEGEDPNWSSEGLSGYEPKPSRREQLKSLVPTQFAHLLGVKRKPFVPKKAKPPF